MWTSVKSWAGKVHCTEEFHLKCGLRNWVCCQIGALNCILQPLTSIWTRWQFRSYREKNGIWFSVLGIVPQDWDLLNQMLCFGATVLQTEGSLTDISGYEFNRINLWLLRPGLSVCVHFGCKLQLLCQPWDINKLISFGASCPKDARRAISFQIYLHFPACPISCSSPGARTGGLSLAC